MSHHSDEEEMSGDEGESDATQKSRFNAELQLRLVELCREKRGLLEATGNSSELNKKRNAAWKIICQTLNFENRTNFTVRQCRKKWHNLKSTSKNKNAAVKKSRRVTGGGKNKVRPLTETEEAVVSIYGETRGFSGEPQAVETSIFGLPRTESPCVITEKIGDEYIPNMDLLMAAGGEGVS